MKSYIEKVLDNSFYQDTYKYLGKRALAPAGFLYDNNQTQKTLLEIEKEKILFSRLNINKIVKNLDILSLDKIEEVQKTKKIYVLLSTGAFNPIHKGHIKMFDLAAKELEVKNKVVVGGFLSPSHDKYVFTKDERFQVSAFQRLLLCENLIYSNSLLTTDRWESLENAYPVNFTDVILRMRWLLNLTLKKHILLTFKTEVEIEVVYVFGSDNYTFMDAFISNGFCVCVPREHEDIIKCKNKRNNLLHFNFNDVINRIFITSCGKQISSTQIRNNQIKKLPS